MAEIMESILGEMIFQVDTSAIKMKNYPSPNKLKRKILIKGKGKLNECVNLKMTLNN